MISGEKVKHGGLWTVLFSLVSLAWVFPIVLVIINSFKQKAYISRDAFSIPTGKAFVGLENYTRGIETTNFFASFGWTLLITVGSVILILVCTSMCAWWIVRVNNWAAKLLYTLFLFNMIVPFQMVMFTLRKLVLAHARQRLRIRREQYRAHARHGRHRRDLHRAFGRQLVLHAARPVPATRFGLRHHDYDSRADFRARVP